MNVCPNNALHGPMIQLFNSDLYLCYDCCDLVPWLRRSRRLLEAAMGNRLTCKQCGYVIVRVDWINRNRAAQDAGFCGKGCQVVYERIKEMEKGRAA